VDLAIQAAMAQIKDSHCYPTFSNLGGLCSEVPWAQKEQPAGPCLVSLQLYNIG